MNLLKLTKLKMIGVASRFLPIENISTPFKVNFSIDDSVVCSEEQSTEEKSSME